MSYLILAEREIKHGQTCHFGWFSFRIVIENNIVDLETLDFKKMASFTRDFKIVDRIHTYQTKVLDKYKVKIPGECTLEHIAHVSDLYKPGCDDVTMYRASNSRDRISGWFITVGADDDSRLRDENNIKFQSLYELTINDPRFAPFWLLPDCYSVIFKPGAAEPVVRFDSWWTRLKWKLFRR